MDYEKIYQETITKLQEMVNSGKVTVEFARGICADFITEDEKIREDITKWFEEFPDLVWRGHCVKDVIAWLEKQGEHQKFIDAIQIGDKVTRNKNGVLVNLSRLDRVAKSADKVEPRFHEGDKIHCKFDDRTFVIKEVNLEKGIYLYTKNECGNDIDYADEMFELVEQNTADNHFTPEQADILDKHIDKFLEQKPVDKGESKFHKEDWIVHQGTKNIYQVVAITDNQYRLKYGNNYTVQQCAGVDRCARLWDITKDAKDGDVLFTSSIASHETFIFKSIDEKGNARCYFSYDSEDGFREGEYHFIGRATDCKPATKEQRDLLFQKMKDSGYEWDAVKKELKKIKQNPVEEVDGEDLWN